MKKFFRSLFLSNRLFTLLGSIAGLFILTFIFQGLYFLPKIFFFVLLAVVVADALLLYRVKKGLTGNREVADKLSNGDENEILIHLQNYYPFKSYLRIYDETPHQFQRRDVEFTLYLHAGEKKSIAYWLRPVKRGEYFFGAVNVLVHSPLQLLVRKFQFSSDKMVPVYPSYMQMRKYELLAIHHRLTESGIKKIRRIGHNQEFELIKEYVSGDDFRTVNWKATARKSKLMVNQYQDEKSQQVYSLIDKGRVMQMPFNGMTLLDYAINASLVISNIAIKKSDKAGLVTFQDRIGNFLRAGRTNNQMAVIQEILYNQKTAFFETDFSALYARVRQSISQRSLLLLYTNFESIHGLHRQLPYLLALNRLHLLVVIFFENTELHTLIDKKTDNLKEIYNQAIAEQFASDKKRIAKELIAHGVQHILTSPEKLSVNTINKYLELKARNLI
ncbi:MAG: DUF58 domain-containing protein [Bacteroidetes bacterium]|nr:DUF58 domain-containing protein [Bacteroidota bacterium]MBS1540599.1 DUF58 domain-containing protein [Bacteroidota bacterium]